MRSTNKIVNMIPVLKINNRKNNLAFYCQTLGMKDLLEEGAFVSLGDQTKVEKLQLEESPSMRTRKVVGTKKLAKIIIKVANPREIEALLARGNKIDTLYQGKMVMPLKQALQKEISFYCIVRKTGRLWIEC